jgi:hypothetical protein
MKSGVSVPPDETESDWILARIGATSYLVIVFSFLACYFSTSPAYIGDTVRYVGDAIHHAQGRETQFWEFGHLLWRPWAHLGHSFLSNWYAQLFSDTPAQAVARFLIQTNFICSVIVLLLLLLILRKVVRAWIAVTVAFAMSCSAAFLNYSQSGAPYIPALLFSTLAFYLLILAAERPSKGRLCALLAGVSFTIACGLWFPYAFSGLGMLAALYLWPSQNSDGMSEVHISRRHLALAFLCSLVVSALLLFFGGAAENGIGSFAQLSQWIRESDNGWQQSRNAMRAVTGLPRSVWNFDSDTILLKRWLWSDPFNPVRIYQIWAFRLGAKLAVYYLGVGAALWVLWKEHRLVLFILVAAGLPMLLFAVALFEPSSPERFLPVFPFAFLAFAVVLNEARHRSVASACLAVFLGSMAVVNVNDNWRSTKDGRLTMTHRRIEALNNSVQPGTLVFVVTFSDGLYDDPAQHPLDHSLAFSRFTVTDTVEVAMRVTTKWRAQFAERTLEQWTRNREVWVSERHLAARPERDSMWVEGDDRRISWPEFPALFATLDFDAKVLPGSDGFLRVARSQANRERLARELGTTTSPVLNRH